MGKASTPVISMAAVRIGIVSDPRDRSHSSPS